MNIVTNAVDYSPEHSEISITAESTNECIRFCISDCGKGFSAEDMREATKQFYMGDSSKTSKSHYGMGLYISKSIVEQHKGRLYIDNSPTAGGAQVIIEMPILYFK